MMDIDEYEYIWTSEKNDWVLVDTSYGYAIVNRKTQFAMLVENDELEDALIKQMQRAGNTVFDNIITAYDSYPDGGLKVTGPETNYLRKCSCCKEGVISDFHDVCIICGWEDDEVQNSNPSYAGGANKDSLEHHRKNFLEMRRKDKNYRWCDTWKLGKCY